MGIDADELLTTNVVPLPGVVDTELVARARDEIWSWFDAQGVRSDDRTTWPTGLVSKLRKLNSQGIVDRCETPELLDVVDSIIGPARSPLDRGWQVLITFPSPGEWTIPHKVWHLDERGTGDPSAHNVARVFIVLDEVVPRGGGTMLVDGSAAMVRRMVAEAAGHDAGKSADIKKRLRKTYDWYELLMSPGGPERERRLVEGEDVDGIPTRVVEMTGAAGDVWIMDQWTLHSLNKNIADRPRLVATKWFWRA